MLIVDTYPTPSSRLKNFLLIFIDFSSVEKKYPFGVEITTTIRSSCNPFAPLQVVIWNRKCPRHDNHCIITSFSLMKSMILSRSNPPRAELIRNRTCRKTHDGARTEDRPEGTHKKNKSNKTWIGPGRYLDSSNVREILPRTSAGVENVLHSSGAAASTPARDRFSKRGILRANVSWNTKHVPRGRSTNQVRPRIHNIRPVPTAGMENRRQSSGTATPMPAWDSSSKRSTLRMS